MSRLADPVHVREDALPTIDVIRTYLPGFDPEISLNLEQWWWSFKLPIAAGAEHQYSLHGETGGERQISAQPIPPCASPARERFWYHALELADFRDDAAKLQEQLHDSVKILMECPTEVIEKKGVMWLSYRARYSADGAWRRLPGGVSYLGLGIGIPFIGRKRVFRSPPIAGCAQ